MIQPQVYGMSSRLEDISDIVLLHYEVLVVYVVMYLNISVIPSKEIMNLEIVESKYLSRYTRFVCNSRSVWFNKNFGIW